MCSEFRTMGLDQWVQWNGNWLVVVITLLAQKGNSIVTSSSILPQIGKQWFHYAIPPLTYFICFTIMK
jgi:hypothetical protein